MDEKKDSNIKKVIDSILIYNLYILIIGAFLLLVSFVLTVNGNEKLYNFFQKLWYPIFIPSLSLFFTAILIQTIINKIINGKDK